jgi:hypothetical protein
MLANQGTWCVEASHPQWFDSRVSTASSSIPNIWTVGISTQLRPLATSFLSFVAIETCFSLCPVTYPASLFVQLNVETLEVTPQRLAATYYLGQAPDLSDGYEAIVNADSTS